MPAPPGKAGWPPELTVPGAHRASRTAPLSTLEMTLLCLFAGCRLLVSMIADHRDGKGDRDGTHIMDSHAVSIALVQVKALLTHSSGLITVGGM